MADKPITLNSEMVKAILDGIKTQARQICKISVNENEPVAHEYCMYAEYPARNYKGVCAYFLDRDGYYRGASQQRIFQGDTLWVRETYAKCQNAERYVYKADCNGYAADVFLPGMKWRPSIHMPREAARLFLRVNNIRVEKLQDIDADGIRAEGLTSAAVHCGDMDIALKEWALYWNNTIKPDKLRYYGWEANPWVWVIEFERMDSKK